MNIDVKNSNTINKALAKYLNFAVFVENDVYLRVVELNYANAKRRDPDGLTRFERMAAKHELVGVYSLGRNASLEQLAAFVHEDCRHIGLMD